MWGAALSLEEGPESSRVGDVHRRALERVVSEQAAKEEDVESGLPFVTRAYGYSGIQAARRGRGSVAAQKEAGRCLPAQRFG